MTAIHIEMLIKEKCMWFEFFSRAVHTHAHTHIICDRQKSGGQNGQQHIISLDPQHWCTAGLRPQPTPVLPVHTRLYSYTQLECHRQIC